MAMKKSVAPPPKNKAPASKPAAAPTRAVARVEKPSRAVAALDDTTFEADAGAGMEDVKSTDLIIPRLSILQDLSPQVKKQKAEYIEGAEVGMIADVGLGQLFEDGVTFLPVKYMKQYLEWAPRDSNRGLVNIHSDPAVLDQCEKNDRGQWVLPNGNYVAETAQIFGFNVTADFRQCFIPMTSTQLKKARKWMTTATEQRLTGKNGQQFRAPLYYRAYNLSTADESNAQGDWKGWVIEPAMTLAELAEEMELDGKELLERCRNFLDTLNSGQARAEVDASDIDTRGSGEDM